MINFNLQACYSISDILFTVSLFTMVLVVILSFFYLIVNLITSAVFEVRDINVNKGTGINTQKE